MKPKNVSKTLARALMMFYWGSQKMRMINRIRKGVEKRSGGKVVGAYISRDNGVYKTIYYRDMKDKYGSSRRSLPEREGDK